MRLSFRINSLKSLSYLLAFRFNIKSLIIFIMTELEIKAEQKYPMPLNACSFVKKKIFWLRERWILSQSK